MNELLEILIVRPEKKWDHDPIILFDDCICEAASGRQQLFKFYRLSPDFMD